MTENLEELTLKPLKDLVNYRLELLVAGGGWSSSIEGFLLKYVGAGKSGPAYLVIKEEYGSKKTYKIFKNHVVGS